MQISTDAIPDLEAGHDEAVIVLAFRRVDPQNEGGDPVPDLPQAFHAVGTSQAAALVAMCEDFGFDPSLSFACVASVTDVESGAAISLSDLLALDEDQPDPEPV